MNKKTIILIIVIVILAAGVGLFFILQKSAFPEPPSQPEPPGQISKYSPFGIHNPKVPDRQFGRLPAGFDDLETIKGTGVKWLRYAGGEGLVWDSIEKEKGEYDWSRTDYLFSDAYKNGINLVVVITSFNEIDQSDVPMHSISIGVSAKAPNNKPAYFKFLETAVERYDGDGINDAPGSPVVNYWEIENEVNFEIFWNDTPENYANFLKESYKVIKQSNPEAKVLISGMSDPIGSEEQKAYDYYFRILKELDRIKEDRGDRYFDIFSIHFYNFDNNQIARARERVLVLKNELKKYEYDVPFWLTETGDYSGSPLPKSAPKKTEKEQAKNLIKIYVSSLVNRMEKIFWVTLTEWSDYGGKNSVWDNVGLINNPKNDGESHKKLSYYTYKKMVEVLEGSDWNNIQKVQESGGVYIYKFNKSGKNIWVAWNDNSASKQITISGIPSGSVKITEAVPKYETGKDVSDYSTAFNTETKSASGGKITITLKDKPVFVEKISEETETFYCEPGKEYKHTQVKPIQCECPEGYGFEIVEMSWGPCAIEGKTDCPASIKKCVPIKD
jgi:hypothetical protein